MQEPLDRKILDAAALLRDQPPKAPQPQNPVCSTAWADALPLWADSCRAAANAVYAVAKINAISASV
jgi:hypothetical protein